MNEELGWQVTIFFDGACPICSREMNFVRKKNSAGAVRLVDTSSPDFDPRAHGISSDPDRLIHGKLPDGTIIQGLEVFRRVYSALGMGWLLAPTAWPVLRPIFDFGYRIFARHRKKIGRIFGGRCDTNVCR